MRYRALALCLLAPLTALAQIYQYTDANGNTVYTNQPPGGSHAREVQLPPLNSVPPATPGNTPAAPVSKPEPAKAAAAYSTLQLTDLPTDEALRANNGTFTVGVALQPRLAPGHLLQLVLDGTPYGTPGNVPRLQLVNIDRGDHSLAVRVLQGEQVVQQSAAVNFTVQRVHR
ncbi:DUF4124 domain-containing protein [Pseudomonas typographi]|nr:DUF4124 domain-containing protein [Pseudomonas typographi]